MQNFVTTNGHDKIRKLITSSVKSRLSSQVAINAPDRTVCKTLQIHKNIFAKTATACCPVEASSIIQHPHDLFTNSLPYVRYKIIIQNFTRFSKSTRLPPNFSILQLFCNSKYGISTNSR